MVNRLPNMQSVLLYPITRLKSDSKIESMQLISNIYNSGKVVSFLHSIYAMKLMEMLTESKFLWVLTIKTFKQG